MLETLPATSEALRIARLDRLPDPVAGKPPGGGNLDRLGEVAGDFESIFLRQLLEKLLPSDGEFFGKESGASSFRGLYVDAIAEAAADRGVLGIKEMIQRDFGRPERPQPETENRST